MMQLIDALAGDDVSNAVQRLALWFTYLGLITFVCHFLETGMFMWSGSLCAKLTFKAFCKQIITC